MADETPDERALAAYDDVGPGLAAIRSVAFSAMNVAAAILQGSDLDGSRVRCRLIHGPSDLLLELAIPPDDGEWHTGIVDLILDGDLPDASYRAESHGRVIREGRLACWLDHTGGKLLGPAPTDNPTGFSEYDRLTHRIMRPQPGQLIQAISWCGHRVHEVPGRGPVDCVECLDLLAEAVQHG